MTKDEFTTAFNSLFTAEKPDPLAIEELRTNVLADYDALTTAQTAVQSFTATNETLAKENKALQETNMKLIMLHPEALNLKDPLKNTSSGPEEPAKELSESDKQKAMDEVLKDFGHKVKE